MFWVACYDIPDDRRRTRVAKLMEGYGRRVQYSVFECDLSPARLQRLEAELKRLIDDREDDVRLYPLNEGDVQNIRLLGLAQLQRSSPFYIV
jgi:CRISPR-associated protein Cas2